MHKKGGVGGGKGQTWSKAGRKEKKEREKREKKESERKKREVVDKNQHRSETGMKAVIREMDLK